MKINGTGKNSDQKYMTVDANRSNLSKALDENLRAKRKQGLVLSTPLCSQYSLSLLLSHFKNSTFTSGPPNDLGWALRFPQSVHVSVLFELRDPRLGVKLSSVGK